MKKYLFLVACLLSVLIIASINYSNAEFGTGAFGTGGPRIDLDQINAANRIYYLDSADGSPTPVLITDDDGNIGFNYNSVNVTNYKILKVTKAHGDDLFDDAGTTKTITLWTQPVNSKIIAVMMKLTEQFVAPSLTDLDVVVGVSGTADGLINTAMNLTSDAVGTEYENVGSFYDAFYEGIHGKTNATITWQAAATAVGANLDATTAGSLDFYIIYEQP